LEASVRGMALAKPPAYIEQFKPKGKNMKLLEAWQIRAALKYAGGPHDDQYMEWLTRALNYFNLSNNNLRCRWSHGTNWSGEYESELETERLRLGEREVAESANPIIRACRESGSAVPPGPLLYCKDHADQLEGKEWLEGMEDVCSSTGSTPESAPQHLVEGEDVEKKGKRKPSGSKSTPDHPRDIADLAALVIGNLASDEPGEVGRSLMIFVWRDCAITVKFPGGEKMYFAPDHAHTIIALFTKSRSVQSRNIAKEPA
jgi:hypothetical protein